MALSCPAVTPSLSLRARYWAIWQAQDDGHALGQRNGTAGVEVAVQIALHQPQIHRRLDIGSGPVALRHVGVGLDGHRVAYGVPAGGGGHRQLGELGPGNGGAQVQVTTLVAHHNVQGGQHLGGLLLGRRGGQGRRSQPQHQHHGQQAG